MDGWFLLTLIIMLLNIRKTALGLLQAGKPGYIRAAALLHVWWFFSINCALYSMSVAFVATVQQNKLVYFFVTACFYFEPEIAVAVILNKSRKG